MIGVKKAATKIKKTATKNYYNPCFIEFIVIELEKRLKFNYSVPHLRSFASSVGVGRSYHFKTVFKLCLDCLEVDSL